MVWVGWGPEGVGPRRGGAPKGGPRRVGGPNLERWGPEGWGPELLGPKGWGPEGGAQNFALFFPSPATIFFLSSLSWGSFRGILVGFLKRRGPEMCTCGVLRSGGAAGVSHDNNTQQHCVRVPSPSLSTPHLRVPPQVSSHVLCCQSVQGPVTKFQAPPQAHASSESSFSFSGHLSCNASVSFSSSAAARKPPSLVLLLFPLHLPVQGFL